MPRWRWLYVSAALGLAALAVIGPLFGWVRSNRAALARGSCCDDCATTLEVRCIFPKRSQPEPALPEPVEIDAEEPVLTGAGR